MRRFVRTPLALVVAVALSILATAATASAGVLPPMQ